MSVETAWKIVGIIQLTLGSLKNGVPDDLIPLIPTKGSPDFGLFSTCEIPRGSRLEAAGICVPPSNLTGLEFCGEFVTYPACIPPVNPLWPSWSASSKDKLLQDLFSTAVAERKTREENSLSNSGNDGTYVPLLYTGNDACMKEYKRVLCLQNFPSCDDTHVQSGVSRIFGICSQRCVDYFTTCKVEATMAQDLCQAGGSNWPFTVEQNSIGTSATSLLVDQEGAGCTGKAAHALAYSLVLIFIAVLAYHGSVLWFIVRKRVNYSEMVTSAF